MHRKELPKQNFSEQSDRLRGNGKRLGDMQEHQAPRFLVFSMLNAVFGFRQLHEKKTFVLVFVLAERKPPLTLFAERIFSCFVPHHGSRLLCILVFVSSTTDSANHATKLMDSCAAPVKHV